jgi:glycosyltransferase involved in cell wall biosynthesis/SAM-dependent methyltransferase
MKRIGGELKFNGKTKTKIFGTIHDLRDFELSSQWESVLSARKKAGCLPETSYSESCWNAEKSKQACHARELVEMYRGICCHESLHTLVTVSDYSAQSIRDHAGRSGPIVVLFAPDKNRPQPEPFDLPGLDFKKDPYLVVLNAARVEKNAASAVAAFEALFTQPEFAKANPRLKLVLVGIQNIANLGMPLLCEHSRLLAISHLQPPTLEFLLINAKGLLYPSFNEGFGYPPLEAMSLGVPCVVSSQTSIPEVCGTAALYCDPGSIDSIASAIREMLANPTNVELLKSHANKIGERQKQDLRRLSELVCGEPPLPLHQHIGLCPICEKDVRFTTNHEWLRDHYICSGCGSIPRERAIMHVIGARYPNWRELKLHESSSGNRGASLKLAKECRNYTATQFDPNLPFGSIHPTNGYRSEDLEKQTFADESFDIVVTQDVMEHIFDAEAAFREIHRTLKPGGAHIFTTPLVNKEKPTLQRAQLLFDGQVKYLFAPEYHGNPMSSEGSLVTWHWGYDIKNIIQEKITDCRVEIINPSDRSQGIEAEYIEVIIQKKHK